MRATRPGANGNRGEATQGANGIGGETTRYLENPTTKHDHNGPWWGFKKKLVVTTYIPNPKHKTF